MESNWGLRDQAQKVILKGFIVYRKILFFFFFTYESLRCLFFF